MLREYLVKVNWLVFWGLYFTALVVNFVLSHTEPIWLGIICVGISSTIIFVDAEFKKIRSRLEKLEHANTPLEAEKV